MSNREKYDASFVEVFMLQDEDITVLEYQSIQAWDSVGHMALMSALEEAFDIELDVDDIIDFSSYEVGIGILKKYEVEI